MFHIRSARRTADSKIDENRCKPKYYLIQVMGILYRYIKLTVEPVHEICNNVVCATSKASDQPAHMRSLIRAFASRLSIL